MHGERTVAHPADRIDQEWQRRHVVQVGVRQEHPIDTLELFDVEVSDAGSGIDQHIFVEHERRRAQTAADTATATEHAQLHPGHLPCL